MNGRLVSGVIAGAVVGAVVGLLVAPKPGRETRRMLRVKAEDCRKAVRGRFKKGRREEEPVALGS